MDKLTPEAIVTFLWVLAALVAFSLGVWGLIDKIKAARMPAQKAAEWRALTDAKLKADKERIDNLESGQKAICKGVLALLNHELHNGNNDEMEHAQAGINEYLISK